MFCTLLAEQFPVPQVCLSYAAHDGEDDDDDALNWIGFEYRWWNLQLADADDLCVYHHFTDLPKQHG